jgi:hypothetical protein
LYYHALARPWGPDLATSQVIGGGVLWIFGDIVGLPFLAAQLIQMIREDEADAIVIDAELDAQEAAAIATTAVASDSHGPSIAADPAAAGNPGWPVTQRPWWETDRRFADRFRSVDEPD